MKKEVRVKLIRAPWFAKKYVNKEGTLKIIDDPQNAIFQPFAYNTTTYISSPLVIENYEWEDEDDTTLIVCNNHDIFTGNIFSNEEFIRTQRYFFIFELLPQKQEYDIHIENIGNKYGMNDIDTEVDYIKECANNIEFGNTPQDIADIFYSLGSIMRLKKISAEEINKRLKDYLNEK